ncbi:MAG TPA: VWA domain-containing protein [Pyrinomonadaceae bacterium]|nr:VWA domain-containing protein [Pyrinomonadaceae bacterium]
MIEYLKSSKVVFIFTLIFTFALSASAQTATPTPTIQEDNDVIKVDSRLVVVPVSVTNAAGQPVLGLTAKDFRVREENQNQQIENVSDAEKVPLEIALLFDISATTSPMFRFQQETAAQFLKDVMRPDDRATIYTVGAKPILLQGRDTAEKAAAIVSTIQPTKEFTAFYDSVAEAAEYLQKNAPQGRRKVIVVISDGEDTNSVRIAKAIQDGYRKLGEKVNTLDQKSLYQFTVETRNTANLKEQSRVLKTVQNADTVFYSINPAGSSYQLNKMSVFGQSNMQKFADETGGTAFLPKFQPIDLQDTMQNSVNTRKNQETLTKIFRQLANELQAQYLVQYYSEENFQNGRYVKLEVGLNNPQNFKVRARQGYFVKN